MFNLSNEYEVSYRLDEMARNQRHAQRQGEALRAVAADRRASGNAGLLARGRRFRGVAISLKWAAPSPSNTSQGGRSCLGA